MCPMRLFLGNNMEIFSILKSELIKKGEIILDLKVITNSSSLNLEKLSNSLYKLKIIKIAQKGKDNLEIIKFFKDNFKPLKLNIEIISGNLKSHKKIKIKLIK